MEEPLNDQPTPDSPAQAPEEPRTSEPLSPPAWEPRFERERTRRRVLLRRLTALLGTGTVAFTLTTWLLLRRPVESPAPRLTAAGPGMAQKGSAAHDPSAETPGASVAALRIARAQLVALNGDDISGAYSYFSPRYRSRVTLAIFRKLVQAHRDMFHTDEQEANTISESEDRVQVDIHVSSDDDEDYVAHYTLVRVNGHWLVDDLRWAFDEDDQGRSSA